MFALREARRGRSNQARNGASKRACRESPLLRSAQPGRGNEFHGTGNLLRILYRTDAALDVQLGWHGI
jgi:hypothetical protein